MLVISRTPDQKIFIDCPDGKRIEIVHCGFHKGREIRLGIHAPPEYRIMRDDAKRMDGPKTAARMEAAANA